MESNQVQDLRSQALGRRGVGDASLGPWGLPGGTLYSWMVDFMGNPKKEELGVFWDTYMYSIFMYIYIHHVYVAA